MLNGKITFAAAEIQIPGTNAARILMDELKVRVPGGSFRSPGQKSDTAEEDAQ